MKRKSILALGASNTFGYDPRSYLGSRYPRDVRWTGILSGEGYDVINYGHNGLMIPPERDFKGLSELIKSRLPVDIITVMLGTNDLLQGLTASETAARMETFLRFVKITAGDAEVILIATPAMKRGEWVQTKTLIEESARLSPMYRALCEKLGVTFLDAGEWGVELSYDGVHFSEEGHAAFARGLMEYLSRK
ncbi:MAG: lipase [Clostridia bacterium]|jgi:lysophospholipase L1-like esterase|nr:lipase [Clostridia bacterium]MBQ1375960.1 lipase [Clostridia bacterium]MBQ4249561.1 lipase [Clostridia bacterium]